MEAGEEKGGWETLFLKNDSTKKMICTLFYPRYNTRVHTNREPIAS